MHEYSRYSTARRAAGRRMRQTWRRDPLALAAMFTAVASVDLAIGVVAHGPAWTAALAGSADVAMAAAAFQSWWARRHGHSPPGGDTTGADSGGSTSASREPAGDDAQRESDAVRAAATGTGLWRLRTTVRDTPGSLAEVCGALARRHVDILTLQTHPLSDGTVDEFLVRAPAALPGPEITAAVTEAGGRHTWLERADQHDLVDTPTRLLTLATRTALDTAELPLALRQLLGRCTIRSVPAGKGELPPSEGTLEETALRLRDPSGGTLVVERPYLPFTPTEFARARALIELDARLGPRVPDQRDVLTLPEGNEITVRRANPSDLAAARAMHDRCSATTLSRRYHGPVHDTERYLAHLLSPRHGRTLAVETASGRLVALGHLLWDGDETEIALLVEDEWQQRGVGAELLRQLVVLAEETGCTGVYAVTKSSNTPMVAAMRGLGLPLDYQVEDGTLVITAALSGRLHHERTPGGRDALPVEAARDH